MSQKEVRPRQSQAAALATEIGEQTWHLLKPLSVLRWQHGEDARTIVIEAQLPATLMPNGKVLILIMVRVPLRRTDVDHLPMLQQKAATLARALKASQEIRSQAEPDVLQSKPPQSSDTGSEVLPLVMLGGKEISPRMRDFCQKQQIGFLDLTGAMFLVGPGLYVERSVIENRITKSRQEDNIYSDNAESNDIENTKDQKPPATFAKLINRPSGYRCLMLLLERSRPTQQMQRNWTTRTLAREVSLSPGMTQRIKDEMAQLGLVRETRMDFEFTNAARAFDLLTVYYLGDFAGDGNLISDPWAERGAEKLDRRRLRGGPGILWRNAEVRSAQVFRDQLLVGTSLAGTSLEETSGVSVHRNSPFSALASGSAEDSLGWLLDAALTILERLREIGLGSTGKSNSRQQNSKDRQQKSQGQNALSGPAVAYFRLWQTGHQKAPFLPHIIVHTAQNPVDIVTEDTVTERREAGKEYFDWRPTLYLSSTSISEAHRVSTASRVPVQDQHSENNSRSVRLDIGQLTIVTAPDTAGFRLAAEAAPNIRAYFGTSRDDNDKENHDEMFFVSDTQIYVDLLRLTADALPDHQQQDYQQGMLSQLIRDFRTYVLRQ